MICKQQTFQRNLCPEFLKFHWCKIQADQTFFKQNHHHEIITPCDHGHGNNTFQAADLLSFFNQICFRQLNTHNYTSMARQLCRVHQVRRTQARLLPEV